MKKRNNVLLTVAVLCGVAISSQAMTNSAKDCTAEWRADKAGMQAKGITEKAYVDQCKEGAAPVSPAAKPAAAAPAQSPTQAAGSAKQKTEKDCVDQWRADKVGMQSRGVTEKAYVDQCRGGSAAAAPAAKPTAPTPAAVAPAPVAPTATPQRPTAATVAKPAPAPSPQKNAPATEAALKTGEFANEAQAKAHCPADTVVWANLNSKIYHFSGGKEYGNTERGAYMCEREATIAEFRAAKNEKHP